jgi:hypothetical protein
MKKLLISSLLIGMTIQIFGQLNPVNNLVWDHDYIYPPGWNHFTLFWDEPDPSNDSLVGYNIYAGNELYKYQTHLGLICREYDSSDCGFFNFLTPGDYIKVTAIYNSPPEESIAVDSAQFTGLMQGIENPLIENVILYPNPANGIVAIDIENIRKIIVINNLGEIVQNHKDKSTIDLRGYSKGIYYFKIITDKGIITEKVSLE